MSNFIAELIQPNVIGDLKSYWAMHFCSILETLYEHKQLEFCIQSLIPTHQQRSLSNFVGEAERGFFSRIRDNINNWGLQYFLCHYLASPDGHNVFHRIISEISNNYNFDLLKNFHSYGIFICGIDSYSGEQFLKTTTAAILGYTEYTIQNVWEDIKYVDLCILIKRLPGDTLDTAILGEVEGNKGRKLFAPDFWEKKSSMCLFGIGVAQGGAEISIHNIELENSIKTVVTLGSNFSVVDDFKIALGMMEVFLSLNHKQKIQLIDGQKEIVEIIKYYWNKPIDELITALRTMINRVETANIGINPLSMTSIPKITT